MNLIPRAVQKPGIDEKHARFRRPDAGFQIRTRAPLLIHDAHFQRIFGQFQQPLHGAKQRIGVRHLFRPMQLRLDDINRTAPRIFPPLQIMQRDQRRHDRVHHRLGHLRPIAQQNRIGQHMMPDIAHQQQRATMQSHLARAIGCRENPVLIELALENLPPLLHGCGKRGLHQPQPVAIHLHFVRRIHRGDTILAIANRADRRFQHHIRHPRRIVFPDRIARIDHQLRMQIMILEQNRGGFPSVALIP